MLITQNPRFKLIYTALKPYIAEFGISKIAVFGSYAKGEDKPDSDIDIIVDMTNNFGIYKFIGLKQSLEETLGKRVDLVEPQCIEPLIKDDVLAQAITIYEQR
jgi:predicted nucleotidyltransferase